MHRIPRVGSVGKRLSLSTYLVQFTTSLQFRCPAAYYYLSSVYYYLRDPSVRPFTSRNAYLLFIALLYSSSTQTAVLLPLSCIYMCVRGVGVTQPVHGSLARFVTHPADFCFKLPKGMSLEEGAMCEPVSVGVHACRRAGVQVCCLPREFSATFPCFICSANARYSFHGL